MARLNRENEQKKAQVANYNRDFEGRRDISQTRGARDREDEEGAWTGRTYGYDYDEDLGFYDDDTSWRRSENLKSGVGRNDYGNNEVLKQHFGKGYHGKGPKGWRRSDDRIHEDVCEALFRDYEVDASDIDVYVKDAVVYLKGTVDGRRAKRFSERLAETVLGVEDVVNELHVRRSDEEIRPVDPAQIDEDRDQQDSNTFN